MYVILALLLLSVLIIAHEAGHFFAARACGIEVQEFSIGMGPLLFQRTTKRGTKISIRPLLIGGFCQFYAEDEDSTDPRAFNNQKVWKRFLTVVSGPLMNFVVAILVIVIHLSAIGVNMIVPKVDSVEENARLAGLMPGDRLTSINGLEITDTDVVGSVLAKSQGEAVTLTVLREGTEKEIVVTPFYDEEGQRYRIGFSYGVERVRTSVFKSLPISLEYNAQNATLILDTLKNLVTRGEGVEDLTGPVGTVYIVQEVTRQGGLDVYLDLIALISVNLGIMNLMPIPGLDGSRILFLIIEALRRKPVKRELEGMIHFAGFALLMGLLVAMTYKDVMWIMVQK